MDGAATQEEAAARWRLELEDAEAGSRQSWPQDVTARISEFEWLTLITEILMPVGNEIKLEFDETQQQEQTIGQPIGDSHGDDERTIGQEEQTGALGVNQVYSLILAAAAACNRWLKEDLGPGLRTSGQDFETPMTLDPATDIDRWARERAEPMAEEPAGDDIKRWLHWTDLRTSGTLPKETAPREEWSEAVSHSMALVREAIHRLTLARLHMRAGSPALMESNVAAQTTENLYRVVVWLASTLQVWGMALVRVHNAVPAPDDGP